MNPINWDKIHALTFVHEQGCWKTCNAYCCKHESDLTFKFLKPSTATLALMEPEYEYFIHKHKLQEGFDIGARKISFAFGEDLALNFMLVNCNLGGLCTFPEFRPLLCKLYPFVPRLDAETGEITSFTQGAVLDQFWPVMKQASPCTLTRDPEKNQSVREGMKSALRELTEHPYLSFHIQAAALFLDAVQTGLAALRAQKPEQSLKAFSAEWEILYLRGKAFDKEKLRCDLKAIYDALRHRHPNFSLAINA